MARYSYKDYLRDLNRNYRQQQKGYRNLAYYAKIAATNAVTKNFFSVAVRTKGYSTNVATGEIALEWNRVPKKLQDAVQNGRATDMIMKEILERARAITPIDKRYASIDDNASSREYDIPSFADFSERNSAYSYRRTAELVGKKGDIFRSSRGGLQDFSNSVYYGSQKPKRVSFYLENNRFPNISRDDNTDSVFRKSELWFNRSDNRVYGTFGRGYNRETKAIDTFKFKDNKNNNQELKKSGRYDSKTKTISFNPIEKGAKFNYASLQHDNLGFKHKFGEALFLYKSYTKKKQEIYDAMEKDIDKVFKKN